MSTAPFVQYDEALGKQILYTPTKAVADIRATEIQDLIAEMKLKMTGVGIGLAANQVGHPLQLFMIQYSPNPSDARSTPRYRLELPEEPFQVFINPRLTSASVNRIGFWHGCLSALGHDRGLVATYEWIEYEAFNAAGDPIAGRLQGMGAVIFQHEFRHLLGRLYVDQAHTFMTSEDLATKFQSGELLPYAPCGEDVPLLLSDYHVGESIEDYARRLGKDEAPSP